MLDWVTIFLLVALIADLLNSARPARAALCLVPVRRTKYRRAPYVRVGSNVFSDRACRSSVGLRWYCRRLDGHSQAPIFPLPGYARYHAHRGLSKTPWVAVRHMT